MSNNAETLRIQKSDKRIRTAAVVTVFVLAISAAVLSYASLYDLAVQAGINPILSSLFPIVIDGLILSGTLLILYFANRGKRSHYGLLLTGVGVIASIAGNVSVSDDSLTAQLVHAAPPVVLFFALEALSILMRARSKEEAARKQAEIDLETALEKTTDSDKVDENHEEVNTDSNEKISDLQQPQKDESSIIETQGKIKDFFVPELEPIDPTITSEPKPQPVPALSLPPLPTSVASETYAAPVREVKEQEVLPVETVSSERVTRDRSAIRQTIPQEPETAAERSEKNIAGDAKDLPETLPEEYEQLPNTRSKAKWLLNEYPHREINELSQFIAGDKKYNRKILREEKEKLSV